MAIDRLHSAAFTGHRTYADEARKPLREVIRTLSEQGIDTFLCGMARGFDLAAAEAVLRLRDEGLAIRLIAVIPFASQAATFAPTDRQRFQQVVALADEVILLSPTFYRGCYQQRNNFLVDHAAHLIAWYNGTRGGTQYTLLRAAKAGLTIHNLSPAIQIDPQLFD